MKSGGGAWLKPFRRPAPWVALWTLAIVVVVVASLAPPPPMPRVSGGDKIGHFVAYALLAGAAVQLFGPIRALWVAGLGLVGLGLGLEWAQHAFTHTRQMEAADALANTLGVLAGLSTRMLPLRDLLLTIDRRVFPA